MKVLFSSCAKNGHTAWFDAQTKTYNHTVSQHKQHHIKVLFSSCAKNGHTAWFDAQTKTYNHTVSQHKQHHIKVLFSSCAKNGHTARFDPQTKKLEPHCITKQTAPHESTAQQLSKEWVLAIFLAEQR